MQRFGTSSVPTHITGLSILRSNWSEAVDSILSLRQNEHPDCVRGRLAWLEDRDIDAALAAMPRRCVAERSIWEFWKRVGGTTDYLGALGTVRHSSSWRMLFIAKGSELIHQIPRNLRTMYVHAYQSYIWNLITSERIKLSSTKPLPGDIVLVKDDSTTAADADANANGDASRSRPALETASNATVKYLTDADVDQYTIFDVVHPLPGFDVEYPKGPIGELYATMLKADGLDLAHMRRDQR